MADSVSEMKKKLRLVETQFSKGYGVYALDPDPSKKGKYSAFLRKHNLKPTEEAVKRIRLVKDSLSKDSSKEQVQAAQGLIEKWHLPLISFDKSANERAGKKTLLKKMGK
jgi:hypothetical protein